ncbi:MAG: hypothetical protein R3221_08825, partial [Spongiibacter sp.]|nr:hypothetical protein [Spongiibacter sp.]
GNDERQGRFHESHRHFSACAGLLLCRSVLPLDAGTTLRYRHEIRFLVGMGALLAVNILIRNALCNRWV